MTGPVIDTARLALRPLGAADYRRWEAFYATPRSRFLGGPMSRARAWEAFEAALAHWRRLGYGAWSVEDRSGAFVGGVSLEWRDGWPAPELNWFLLKTATGFGYASEAAGALRDHAFGALGLRALVSFVNRSNLDAARVARRLGAVPDRSIRAPGDDGAVVWRHRPAGPLGVAGVFPPGLRFGPGFDLERTAA